MAQTYDIDIKINVDDSDLQDTANSLKDLEGSAEEAGNALQQAFNEATAEVERLEDALDEAYINGDDIEADYLADALADARAEADALAESLQSAGDAGSLSDAQAEADALADSLRDAGDAAADMGDKTTTATEQITNSSESASTAIGDIASVAAGVGSAMGLMTMVDTAGRIEASWDRLGITFGGVSDGLRSSVDSAAAATGRSGSSIREYFNMMGIAGIKNTDLLNQSFQALSGKAFQTGADVGQLSSLMQKMALSGNAGARQLTMLGLSTDQLGAAMGVAGSEASKAFKELSQEERLRVLTQAMGDGSAANEAYKNSWEGVKEQAGNAMAGLMGAVGSAILPVVVPAMNALKDAINTVKGVFTSLPGPVQGVIGVLGGGVAGFVALSGALTVIGPVVSGLLGTFNTMATVVKAVAAADSLAAGAKAALTILLGEETMANISAAAAWMATAAAEAVALWPILAIIGAIALLVVGFEKLGEWLGWWDDFGGMVEAAKSAISRLWDAFMGSRIVQAAIGFIKGFIDYVISGLQMLWSVIQPILSAVWDAFASLFSGEGGGGDGPDAVQAIIDAFTFLEDIVIGVFDAIQFVAAQIINIFLPVINGIQLIAQVVQGMFTGQIGILDGLMIIGQTISNMFVAFWSAIGNLFMQGFMTLMNIAFNGLMSIWNSFLGFLGQLATVPGRVGAYLLSVVQKVISWASSMVSKAQTAATNFVNSVINGIANLPSRFRQSIDRVLTELANWGKQMVDKAAQIMRDVANYIGQVTGLTSGFDSGFDAGFTSYGFDSGNTLNSTIAKSSSSNRSSVTNNFSINGIIEEEASEYIVNAVNENIRRQNLIRGV